MKNKIDSYIDNIYKNFDKNDEEVKELKEEMKINLYDEVKELKKQGFNEQQCVTMAIRNFGEEKSVIQELKDIINKQNKVFKLILKLAVIFFIVAVMFNIIGIYKEGIYGDKLIKNKAPVAEDIINNKIISKMKNKEYITETEKSSIVKLFDKFNKDYNNGLYYVKIIKLNDVVLEYKKDVPKEMITQQKSYYETYGNNNEWKIYYKITDYEKMREIREFDNIVSSGEASNLSFNILKKVSYQLAIVSWIFIIIYFLQKAFLDNKHFKMFILLISIESFFMINCLIIENCEELIIPIIVIAVFVNIVYEKFCKRKVIECKC